MKTPLRRGLKTPAQLAIMAARLFAIDKAEDQVLACRSNASASSNGSVTYDQMYLDQCHNWFTRETRAAKTPKPESLTVNSAVVAKLEPKSLRKKSVHSVPRMKSKRLTKCLDLSSLPSDGPCSETSMEQSSSMSEPGCVGCSAKKNKEISSSIFFKLLSNNVLICAAHRFITHWMIDASRGNPAVDTNDQDFKPLWKAESDEVQADREVPFSVTEDRRIVAGVDRFGTDAWEMIMNDFYFLPGRKPDDLKNRWEQIRTRP